MNGVFVYMSSISAFTYGIQGIQRGYKGFEKNAAEIASAKTFDKDAPGDVTRPLVNMKINKLQVAASAQVIKTMDETLGTIIDIMA